MEEVLSVREIQESDIEPLVSYWLNADAGYLKGLGADISRVPPKEEWIRMLTSQIEQDIAEKNSYCIIWLVDGVPSGHSNINKIVYGQEAFMHLHLWNDAVRRTGFGSSLLRMTLPYYFNNFKLKTLYCEPYALNQAPNKTLGKLGFELVKEYVTIPGYLNFEQPVCLWQMTEENFRRLYS